MQETTRIIKTRTVEILGVQVQFTYEYEEGTKPNAIRSNFNTPEGLNYNGAFYPETGTREAQVYGLKGEMPEGVVSGIIAQYEEINSLFNQVNQ